MNTQTPISTLVDDSELSLWEILDFLKESWRWLMGGLLLGLLCSVAYLLVTPKKFEARALFHGAKVLGVELESSAQLIERLRFPTFYQADQLIACDIGLVNSNVDLAKRVNAMLLKGTNILQVTYAAPTSELAVRCLDAVMGRVIDVQNRSSESIIQNAKNQLELTKQQLHESERLQSMLEKRSLGSLDSADARFSQTVLLMSTVVSKKDQIATLRKTLLDQMANLEPPSTRPAELIEPIYAPELAVFPKKTQVLVGGLLGGLVLGGLAFFVRRSWLKRRV